MPTRTRYRLIPRIPLFPTHTHIRSIDTMFCKIVLAAVLLVAAVASPVDKRSTSAMELVSIIQLEEPCVRQGGLCLRIEDCPAGNLVQMRGKLCPTQHHLGVECCYL